MSDQADAAIPTAGSGVPRRDRQQKEKSAGRALDAAAGEAIAKARALAPEVVDAPSPDASERCIDVDLASLSEANFVRKRVNAALSIDEWLDEVAVWVWQAKTHNRPPLSSRGQERGFELRMEQAPNRS